MNQKTTKIKKIIIAVFLIASLLSAAPAVHGYWGETYTSLTMKQVMEEAFELFKSVILRALKQAANESIIEQMRKLAAGTTGQPIVISDYKDFIFGTGQRQADKFVTDFFRVLQSGGVSPESRSELRMVERAIRNEIVPQFPKVEIDYQVDSNTPRKDAFDQSLGGGLEAYMAMQFGEYDHPIDAYFNSLESMQGESAKTQKVQETKAEAGDGFDTIISGSKVTPGSVMKDLLVATESMPIEMINNASTWQEVVASMAVKTLSSFVKSGINVVTRPIDNQIRRIERTVEDGIRGIQSDIYRGIN